MNHFRFNFPVNCLSGCRFSSKVFIHVLQYLRGVSMLEVVAMVGVNVLLGVVPRIFFLVSLISGCSLKDIQNLHGL